MRIAAHNIPSPNGNDAFPLKSDTDFQPRCDWGHDIHVQWARNLNGDGAFFEGFMDDGIMVRGDGASLEEAEHLAFEKYAIAKSCEHQWSRYQRRRDRYMLNGVGECRHCGQTSTRIFKPVTELGKWQSPLGFHDLCLLLGGGLRSYRGRKERPGREKDFRRIEIKARIMGIQLPPVPADPYTDDEFIDHAPSSFRNITNQAIASWYLRVVEDGSWPIEQEYIPLLSRRIVDERHTASWTWRSRERRSLLRDPQQIPGTLALIEGDQNCLFATFNGIKFRPRTHEKRDWVLNRYQDDDAGFLPGDAYPAELRCENEELCFMVPDGRFVIWYANSSNSNA